MNMKMQLCKILLFTLLVSFVSMNFVGCFLIGTIIETHDIDMYVKQTYIPEETTGSYEVEYLYESAVMASYFLPKYEETIDQATVTDFYIRNALDGMFGYCLYGLELKYGSYEKYVSAKQALIDDKLFNAEDTDQKYYYSDLPETPLTVDSYECYLAGGSPYTYYDLYYGIYCFNDRTVLPDHRHTAGCRSQFKYVQT